MGLLLLVLLLADISATVVPHAAHPDSILHGRQFGLRLRKALESRHSFLVDESLSAEQLEMMTLPTLLERFGDTEMLTALQHRFSLPPKSERGIVGQRPGALGDHFGMIPICENKMSLRRFYSRAPAKVMSRFVCPVFHAGDMLNGRFTFDADESSPMQDYILDEVIQSSAEQLMGENVTGIEGFLLVEIKILFQPAHYSFPFHYDCTERFIVQLEGKKTMHTYRQQGNESLHDNGIFFADDFRENVGGKLTRYDLEPGQMLYVPAHQFHSVEVDESSVTMVLSFHKEARSDWWDEMIDKCEKQFSIDYTIQSGRQEKAWALMS